MSMSQMIEDALFPNTSYNAPLAPLRYTHFDHSQLIIDVRTQPNAAILSSQCYFVGFRVSVVRGYDYFHALILAEESGTLAKGIEAERDHILSSYPYLYSRDVVPVYIRSMNSEDEDSLSDEGRVLMSDHLKVMVNKRDDDQYVILGLKDQNFIGCVEVQATDAWTAMCSLKSPGRCADADQFKPLQVCQAHPVTAEFVKLFLQVARRFTALSGLASSGMMH